MTYDCIFGIASVLAAIIIVVSGACGLWMAWQWAVAWWDEFFDGAIDHPLWIDNKESQL